MRPHTNHKLRVLRDKRQNEGEALKRVQKGLNSPNRESYGGSVREI